MDTLDGRHYRALAGAVNGTRHAFREPPWSALPKADLIVLVGARPDVTHPMVFAFIRQAILQTRTTVAVLGPDNPLGTWAGLHLPAGRDELPQALQLLLAELGAKTAGAASAKKARWMNEALVSWPACTRKPPPPW